jgi:hypothetical protein
MARPQSSALGMVLAALVALLIAGTTLGQEAAIRGKCVGVHDGASCTLLVSGDTQIKIRVAFGCSRIRTTIWISCQEGDEQSSIW